MKVVNCPVCHVTPQITATEFRCPKCGKVAKGATLPETVKNWNDGNYATVTKLKVEAVEVEKDPQIEAEAPKKAEKPAEKSTKSTKTTKNSEKKPAKSKKSTKK